MKNLKREMDVLSGCITPSVSAFRRQKTHPSNALLNKQMQTDFIVGAMKLNPSFFNIDSAVPIS
jgi:hypothetical protein